jgi:hypothetical protein
MFALLLSTLVYHPMIVHRWVDTVGECNETQCNVVLDDGTPAIVYHQTASGDYVTCRVRLSDETVHCDWRTVE